jgi:geranylgeranyl reductase
MCLGQVRARCVIGADGARSEVARQAVPGAEKTSYVFAYHEILERPANPPEGYDPARCDVVYRGSLSPDFYGWVFPARQDAERGHRQCRQGLLAAPRRG